MKKLFLFLFLCTSFIVNAQISKTGGILYSNGNPNTKGLDSLTLKNLSRNSEVAVDHSQGSMYIFDRSDSTYKQLAKFDGDTILGNSKTKAPSQYAVKKYVDENAGGGGGSTTTRTGIVDSLGLNPISANVSYLTNNYNTNFLVPATAILRVGNSWSNGVDITWNILTFSDGHGSMFFTSVNSRDNLQLYLKYPRVKRVFYFHATPDESFSSSGVFTGASVGLDSAGIRMAKMYPICARLQGNGTASWTVSGNTGSFLTVGTYGGGATGFDVVDEGGNVSGEWNQITYEGTNNYRIRRKYSALGAYNNGFEMINIADNTLVTSNPTSSDNVYIQTGGSRGETVESRFFTTSNKFLTTSHNIWVSALFESWMVVNQRSRTSNIVRFQTDYPYATTYKLYRYTNSNYTGGTLIYTGNAGTYVDTGLTPDTIYYYKLFPVISGVDTEARITFSCITMK